MKSIIQAEKECFICGTKEPLHKHHVFGGANRKLSDEHGCWVWLCASHHNMTDIGVHFNKPFDVTLKKFTQTIWEQENKGGHDGFRKIFGKSYL